MDSELCCFDEVLAFVEASERASTPDALVFELHRSLGRFGFEHYVFTFFPGAGEGISDAILFHRLPDGWIERYGSGGFYEHDPVVAACRRSRRPFTWAAAAERAGDHSEARAVMDCARSHGMSDGVCLPVHGAGGAEGCISVSGPGIDPDIRVLQTARIILSHAYLHGRRFAKARRAASTLTPREREVLALAARGYSARRTGLLLGISERTVTAHLVSAGVKLSAPNKTAAVASALDRRLIAL